MTTSPASSSATTAKAHVATLPRPLSTATPTSPTSATAATTAASPDECASEEDDTFDDGDEFDDDESDPIADELRAAGCGVPYISLLARAKVLEQAMGSSGGPQQHRRRESLRRASIDTNNSNNNNNQSTGATAVDPAKRMLMKNMPRSRSFRMSIALGAGDDSGLHDLVNHISSEAIDRRALVVHAALTLWQHRDAAAALRRWKELLMISSDVLQLMKTGDVNEEARRILNSAEATRTAIEIAAAATPASSRAAGKSSQTIDVAVKFSRSDLDVLVVWARQMQAKTFPRGVDDATIREMMKYLRFRKYQDGDALFFEGEIGELFYFVFHGTVAVYVGSSKAQRKRVDGTRRTTRIQDKPDLAQLGKRVFAYRTGEGFGETAMFTPDAIRTASAIAVGACEVCELPKDVYKWTLKRFHQQFFEQAQTINFIQRVALFRDWQRVRLNAIADVLEKRKLAFGDALLVERSSILTSCFFVLSGSVKLTKHVDVAPPPLRTESNQSTTKKPVHRIQMNIELRTVGVADIVALEALLETNARATYSAVAASASVELYVLKQVDAQSVLGSAQSSVYQRIRELCDQDKQQRTTRLDVARRTFHEHDERKRDAELLQRQDDFDDAEQRDDSARAALDARADAALHGGTSNNCSTASPALLRAGAAPYLPHVRATNLLELAKTPFVPLPSVCRAENDALTAVASPRMLSACAKNFILEHAHTLASDYPERLRQHFPSAPPANRALVEKITALMAPMSSSSSPAPLGGGGVIVSPRQTARRVKPTTESRDAQRVLGQQMQRMHDVTRHSDGTDNRQDTFLTQPLQVSRTGESDGVATGGATTKASAASRPAVTVIPIRPTALHRELQATQNVARKLVEAHLRKANARHSETTGPTTFLHFF